MSPLLHVAAKRNSPWISTSKLPSVAFYNYIREGYGVAAIDLSRIANRVEDVSGEIVGEGRFEQYARRHHEVLCVDGASTTAVTPSPLVAIVGRLQDLGFRKRAGAVFTVDVADRSLGWLGLKHGEPASSEIRIWAPRKEQDW